MPSTAFFALRRAIDALEREVAFDTHTLFVLKLIVDQINNSSVSFICIKSAHINIYANYTPVCRTMCYLQS